MIFVDRSSRISMKSGNKIPKSGHSARLNSPVFFSRMASEKQSLDLFYHLTEVLKKQIPAAHYYVIQKSFHSDIERRIKVRITNFNGR